MHNITYYRYRNAVLGLAKDTNSDFNNSVAIVSDTVQKVVDRLLEEGFQLGVNDVQNVDHDFLLPVFAAQYPGKIIDVRPNPALVVAESVESIDLSDYMVVGVDPAEGSDESVTVLYEKASTEPELMTELGLDDGVRTEMVETGTVELIEEPADMSASLSASTTIITETETGLIEKTEEPATEKPARKKRGV